MIFCKKIEEKVGKRNRMIWLLLCEVNRLYDAVFLFQDQTKINEYQRLRRYLMNKINLE